MFTLLVLQVINFYMNLLMERNKKQGYPLLHAFSTFFYPKLKSGGYQAVKRWTKGVNLFEQELILVPIHRKVHWSLVVSREGLLLGVWIMTIFLNNEGCPFLSSESLYYMLKAHSAKSLLGS